MNTFQSDSSERLLALLSHLGTIFGGILLPLIIWASQKDRTQFVRFHALQALFFQIVYVAAIFFVIIIFFVLYFVIILGAVSFAMTDSGAESGMPFLMILSFVVLYGGIFVALIFFIGYSIYVGVKSYQGEMKMYPVIGKIIYRKVFNTE